MPEMPPPGNKFRWKQMSPVFFFDLVVSPGLQHDTVSAPPNWSQCQGGILSPCRFRVPWRSWAWIFFMVGHPLQVVIPPKKTKPSKSLVEAKKKLAFQSCLFRCKRSGKQWAGHPKMPKMYVSFLWPARFGRYVCKINSTSRAWLELQYRYSPDPTIHLYCWIWKSFIDADARLRWSAYFVENRIFPYQKSSTLDMTKPTPLNSTSNNPSTLCGVPF